MATIIGHLIRRGRVDGGEKADAKIGPEYVVDDGDVVFSWSGSLMVKVWCGGRAALNQHLFKVTSTRFPKWFLFHSVGSHLVEFQSIAAGKATTMGHIKRQHLKEAKCVVPNTQVLFAADGIFSALFDKGVFVKLEARTLTALRDALLPKLLSGELRLKDADEFVESLP